MNSCIAGPSRQRGSYVAVVALIVASIALGLWFFQPPGRTETAATVTVLQARDAPSDPSASSLRGSAERGSYRGAVEKAAPSVVNVYTAKRAARRIENPLFRYFYGDTDPEEPSTALGSGVVMSAQGYILNGERIADSGGLMNKAAELLPGSKASLGILRGDQESTLTVEVGQRPPSRRKS